MRLRLFTANKFEFSLSRAAILSEWPLLRGLTQQAWLWAGWRAGEDESAHSNQDTESAEPAKDLGTGLQCAHHHLFLEGGKRGKRMREEWSMAHRGEVQSM